jgi:hypothetical protein
VNAGEFVQWQDLFVVLDNGAIPLARYGPIEAAMLEQARPYPNGIACLVILPPETRPPPDNVKVAVKGLLTHVVRSLSCLAYVVEGTGFKGIAARATLVGMKIFASRPYPIYVDTSLKESVGKVLPHLVNGHTTSVSTITKLISDARMPMPSHAPKVGEFTVR